MYYERHAKKSDAKDRMIAAARRLFREHGYLGTALSDVVTESAAPGSVRTYLVKLGTAKEHCQL
jgi:AcrR family transcriptional regulator